MTLGESFDPILSAARTGAPWALDRLYSDVAPVVLAYLRHRGATDPEDTLGDVFLDIVRSLDRFSGGERDFRSWALTIAHRRSVDSIRRRKRGIEEFPTEAPEPTSTAADAETEAIELIGSQQVRAALASLSPDQGDVLLLRILGDLTVDEVARTLGKRPGAVKALQRRGLAALRRKMSTGGVPL